MRLPILFLRTMAFGLIVQYAFGQPGDTFVRTGDMTTIRHRHRATLLQDGRVLITGGSTSRTAELFDPDTGTFSQTGEMSIRRFGHTATLLMDGRVLLTGGDLEPYYGFARECCLNSAEVYDPVTGTFAPTGFMNWSRSYHSTALLSTGKVLVTGGTANPETYDPVTGTFSLAADNLEVPSDGIAFGLYSGKVLFAGVENTIYDPDMGVIEKLNAKGNYHGYAHASTMLANGQVLIAGGATEPYSAGEIRLVSQFDSISKRFLVTPGLLTPRAYHTATALADGRVLIAGGYDDDGEGALSSTEIYDAVTGKFMAGPPVMGEAHIGGAAILLRDGRVLVAGGWNTATAELFVPAPRPDSGCMYRITPSSLHFGVGGGTVPITISADQDCSWILTGFDPWVMIPGPNYGVGTTTLDITIAASDGHARVTKISVAGKIGLEINQSSLSCTYSLKEDGRAFSAGESRGSVQVVAALGSGWKPKSNAPCISISGGGSGALKPYRPTDKTAVGRRTGCDADAGPACAPYYPFYSPN